MSEVDRTKGKYPVSIGTSTALESFFGVSDTKPTKPNSAPYTQYECILANVRTLARNYLSSFKSADLIEMSVADLHTEFVKELILIGNVVSDQSRGNIALSVYNVSYNRLDRTLRKANIKAKHTAKQQYLIDLENTLADRVSGNSKMFEDYFHFEHATDQIKQGARRNVIITHYPIDLLFTPLDVHLLESHTGRIKKSFEFNTKLKKAPTDTPFNKYTLQVFGDSSGYFLPYSSAMRNELAKLCEDVPSISPVMQDKKFLKSVKSNASPELKSLINSM